MFLLPSLAAGFVVALLLGGDLSRLLAVRFRLPWTVPLALAIQIGVFSPLGTSLPESERLALHTGSYAILLAFALANVRVRSFIPVLLGIAANGLAIAANGGRMPGSDAAAAAAGVTLGAGSVSTQSDRLWFLGDVFALPSQLPLANVFSIGDLLIGFGMIGFVVFVATSGGGDPVLDIRRLVEPLRTKTYRRLAAGKLVSHLGDWLTLTALVGWIYERTGSPANVAVLLIVRLAPPILGAGVASIVVDRLPKHRVIIAVELLRGLAVGAALVAVVLELDPLVYVVVACSGAFAAVSAAAVPALVPSLLPASQLAPANAGIGIAKDFAMAIGALSAGAALSWTGPAPALVLDLVTFAIAAVLFLGVRTAAQPERRERVEGAPNGVRYLLRRRRLLLIVASFAAATLATGLANASFPGFFDQELKLGAGGYGFAIAALAVGLTMGQALVGFARVGNASGRWIGAGLLLMAFFFVLLGLGTHLPTALLVIAAIGFVDGTTEVLFDTFVQHEADPRYYGAIFGIASAWMTTTMVAAIAAAPILADVLDPHGVILGASVFLLVAGVIALVGMRSAPVEAVAPAPSTRLLQRGDELSLLVWGELVGVAHAAVALVAGETGTSIEIVDVGARSGWDRDVVLDSVRKTSKALIAGNGGLDAELAATIVERAFEDLDAPVRRLAAPTTTDLADSLRSLAAY